MLESSLQYPYPGQPRGGKAAAANREQQDKVEKNNRDTRKVSETKKDSREVCEEERKQGAGWEKMSHGPG